MFYFKSHLFYQYYITLLLLSLSFLIQIIYFNILIFFSIFLYYIITIYKFSLYFLDFNLTNFILIHLIIKFHSFQFFNSKTPIVFYLFYFVFHLKSQYFVFLLIQPFFFLFKLFYSNNLIFSTAFLYYFKPQFLYSIYFYYFNQLTFIYILIIIKFNPVPIFYFQTPILFYFFHFQNLIIFYFLHFLSQLYSQ